MFQETYGRREAREGRQGAGRAERACVHSRKSKQSPGQKTALILGLRLTVLVQGFWKETQMGVGRGGGVRAQKEGAGLPGRGLGSRNWKDRQNSQGAPLLRSPSRVLGAEG